MNKFFLKFSLKDQKSRTVAKNVLFSFFIKGINISISFLTIPLVLSFLNTTQYGIWLTLTAVLGWFSLFDLGFGNGLRNKLTISLATGSLDDARVYVSTTYAALALIFGTLLAAFLTVHPFVNWIKVFNAPADMQADLNSAVLFAIGFLFLQFVLRLITTVLLSHQKSAFADMISTVTQIFVLIGLYALKELSLSTLKAVSIVYSLMPVLVFGVFTLVLFSRRYRHIRPSIRYVKSKYAKGLLNIGLNFFVIQVAALVLYASDNFIISQFFDPSKVTTYNIAFKYFSITNMAFTIVLVPFWSMTTKSHAEGDVEWIKKAIRQLVLLWILLFSVGLLQLFASDILYRLWTGGKVTVPFELSAMMLCYFIIMNWGVIFGNFLNGVGKVRVQLYYAIFGMVINVPLALIFIKYLNIGILGVPLATICTMIGGNMLATIQYRKIIRNTATGVWNA